MFKIIIISVFLALLQNANYPKDVTGKWVVDSADIPPEMMARMQPQQRDMMVIMMQESFRNASFDLKPDHHCSVSVAVPNMPKSSRWDYDAARGLLTLSDEKNPAAHSVVMNVTTVKDGKTTFSLPRAKVVLRVRKG